MNIERLIEVDGLLRHSFLANSYHFCFIVVMVLICLYIILLPDLNRHDLLGKAAKWVGVSIIPFILLGVYSYTNAEKLEVERIFLSEDFEALEIPLKTILVKDVLKVEELKADNCYQLERGETCYFLEFRSNGNINQTVIGLEKPISTLNEDELSLQVYDYEDKELQYIWQVTTLDKVKANRSKLVNEYSWSVGYSIE